MIGTTSARSSRVLVQVLEQEFARLHNDCRRLVAQTADDLLYGAGGSSVGECVLRSAAAVEQTCGGLNSNLWDDPFEWTLPETLSTSALVLEYLDEVEETRSLAFARFRTDAELFQEILLPTEELQPIINVLVATLVKAAKMAGQAAAVAKSLSAKPT